MLRRVRTRRVDDEEPPSTTVQFLPPRAVARFSRPKRPRATAERDIFSPGAPPGRTPRSTFQTRAFRKAFYPDVPDREWNDWHWQARNRLRTLAQLEQVLVLSDDERAALSEGGSMLPVSITPYYMSLVSRDDRSQPLRRTVIPTHGRVPARARARPTTRWAKTATAPCRAWSIAIPTACCCW